MKKVLVQDAVGLALCHDITKVIPGKFKDAAFKRNQIVTPGNIEELLQLGKEHVYVWEEKNGEIHEDEAAVRIAKATVGANITYDKPNEGKVILQSTCKGLFKINNLLLYEINSIENIAVASLPDNFSVDNGRKLASARIIPLVMQETGLKQVEALCQSREAVFEVKPYQKLKFGIITTGNEIYKGRIEDKFGPVIKKKMAYFEAESLGQVFCPDDLDIIEETIASFVAKQADLIILTGGMSVDPDDLTPGAIRNSGAEVVTYGTPVQPGNMFMLAYLKNAVLMGVPGAALYAKNTIFDVVLPRIFAGETLAKKDFVQMGRGGFCSDCNVCHYPNCYFGR